MSIGLYTAANNSTLVSSNNSFTNSLLVGINGRLGGVFQQRLFVRNSESNKSYSAISLFVENPVDPTLINGTQNILWKLSAGDTQPTDDIWLDINTGNTISLPNIGTNLVPDSTTYLPFWLYVRIPRNTNIGTFTGINIVIDANEILVP